MNVSWYNKTDNIDKMNNLYIYILIIMRTQLRLFCSCKYKLEESYTTFLWPFKTEKPTNQGHNVTK